MVLSSAQAMPLAGAGLWLRTEAGCSLAIGRWPRFAYNASGGGGPAFGGPAHGGVALEEGWQGLQLDPAQLTIPDLCWRTTRFLGLPLPPGLRIALRPERLEGRWHHVTGALELDFAARFQFSLGGGLYRAPDLIVRTRLTTAAVVGSRHQAVGQPLDGLGRGQLVGVAQVAPSGDRWLDRFLGLPDEALALLRCRLAPEEEPAPPAPAFRAPAVG